MNYLKRIRELREDNDYTQAYIGSFLNIGQRTYSDYESGKTRIPLDAMIRLAKLYNVDMNYICCISDCKKSLSADINMIDFFVY